MTDATTPTASDSEELRLLRMIQRCAALVEFSAYPAHGSGFVVQATGEIDGLRKALAMFDALAPKTVGEVSTRTTTNLGTHSPTAKCAGTRP